MESESRRKVPTQAQLMMREQVQEGKLETSKKQTHKLMEADTSPATLSPSPVLFGGYRKEIIPKRGMKRSSNSTLHLT